MPKGSPGPQENGGLSAERSAPYGRLERAGRGAWWAVGLIVLAAVALYLLRRYGSFIIPSLIGIVLATTLSPVVAWMERRRVPRLLGAVIVSIVIVALLLALAWAAVVIVVDQSPQIWHTLTEAGARIDRWLGGTGEASDTVDRVEKAIGGLRSELGNVVPIALAGVRELYELSVAVFLAGGFTFFFLWEGPLVRRWVSRHLAQPEVVGLRITSSLVRTTRRYVAGLSGIGATEAVVVGATAAVVGESAWPLIALVIFIGNYIPYIGGIVAGAFAVLLTLGDLGVGPAVVVLIAIVVSFFAGSHIGAFFIGGALRLPVTAVFVLTMAGATVAGLFGAAATAPLARLIIDARDIIRDYRAESAEAAGEDEGPAAGGDGEAPGAGAGRAGPAAPT
jgi:predicted PurR-regulated permease PerM